MSLEIRNHEFSAVKLKTARCRLASHISKRRVELGMRQEELAEKIGLSRTSITNIELGNQGIIADELPKWAKALKWSTRQIARGLE